MSETLRTAVLLLTCLCGAKSLQQGSPPFDGVLRVTADGRAEAYLKPPFTSNHASNLELLPNHDVLLAWHSGPREGPSGKSIVMSRLHSGSRQFSNATVLSQRPGYSNHNPVLFHDNVTDRVYLFHSQQELGKSEADAEVWALQSQDSVGNSWTKPQPLFTKPGSFDRNRVIVSLNQTWLLPIYYSRSGIKPDTSSVMEGLHHNLRASDWREHTIPLSFDLIQPSIVRPKPGQPKLIAFFRDELIRHIYRSESDNDGVKWSRPTKTTLPNNGSGIQATVLQSGNMAMVYNPTHSARNPLVISLSEDGGSTWPYTRTLQESGNKKDEFSYPSIAQAENGQIHVSHTYLRQTIKYHIIPNEQWIKGHL